MIFNASVKIKDPLHPSGWRELRREIDLNHAQICACRKSEQVFVLTVWPEFFGQKLTFAEPRMVSVETVEDRLKGANRAQRRKFMRAIKHLL